MTVIAQKEKRLEKSKIVLVFFCFFYKIYSLPLPRLPLPPPPLPLLLPATACTSAPANDASALTPPPTAASLTTACQSGVLGRESVSVSGLMSYEIETVGTAGLLGSSAANFSETEYW